MPNADRWNIPFVNKALLDYLEHDRHKEYKSLILSVVKNDDEPGAKYNLWTLLMNKDCAESEIKHASERIANLYCADTNIAKYLHECIMYNPKFNYVSVSTKSGRDMKNNYSLDLHLSVPYDSNVEKQFENADKVVARCKEVLTIMLVESKTVPYEKIDPEESKA